jgi:hypothetical protein
MDLHFIHKENSPGVLESVQGTEDWESGYWSVSQKIAEEALGGNIYLHHKQADNSFEGGVIKGYRVATAEDSEKYQGRIIFRFTPTREHKDVPPGGGPSGDPHKNWNVEQMVCR